MPFWKAGARARKWQSRVRWIPNPGMKKSKSSVGLSLESRILPQPNQNMKVTYVSHACLLIETGESLITTDPWFDGPAFCGQWNVFPRPVDSDAAAAADVVLISHPHEDHLHEPTLRRMCKEPKKLFYPF